MHQTVIKSLKSLHSNKIFSVLLSLPISMTQVVYTSSFYRNEGNNTEEQLYRLHLFKSLSKKRSGNS